MIMLSVCLCRDNSSHRLSAWCLILEIERERFFFLWDCGWGRREKETVQAIFVPHSEITLISSTFRVDSYFLERERREKGEW